jgi:hypothetical protein
LPYEKATKLTSQFGELLQLPKTQLDTIFCGFYDAVDVGL